MQLDLPFVDDHASGESSSRLSRQCQAILDRLRAGRRQQYGASHYRVALLGSHQGAEGSRLPDRHRGERSIDRPPTLPVGGKPMKIHPIADILPRLTSKQFQDLKASIEANGLMNPLMAIERDGETILIDGRHRLKACEELGIKPVIDIYDAEDSELGSLVWGANGIRRHLSPSQRAAFYSQLCGERPRSTARIGKSESLPILWWQICTSKGTRRDRQGRRRVSSHRPRRSNRPKRRPATLPANQGRHHFRLGGSQKGQAAQIAGRSDKPSRQVGRVVA